MSDERVTITDCRQAGFCAVGLREGCARLGIDFRRLVKEGIPLSEVETVDDVNVQRTIKFARERIENGR